MFRMNILLLTAAAQNLNTNKNTLQRYILNSKLFKGIYKLESNLSVSNFDSNYLNHSNSIEIEVTDLELNNVTRFPFRLKAARALGIRVLRFLILLDVAKLNHLKKDLYSKIYNFCKYCSDQTFKF